ncbi:MAG: AEC family transporter [Actinomycetota bacterium]
MLAGMTRVLSQILPILILIGLGCLLRMSGFLTRDLARGLTRLIVAVLMPALIFRAVHEAKLSSALAAPAAVGAITVAGSIAATFGVAVLLGLRGERRGALILAGSFGNTGYLGYPMTVELLGANLLPAAVFYDVVGNTPIVFGFGAMMAQHYGAGEDRPTVVNGIRTLASFPPLWGLVAGLALHGVSLPAVVARPVELLAGSTIPLIMLAVGASLTAGGLRRHWKLAGVVAVMKLGVSPAIAYVAARLLGASPDITRVAVLEAGMPTFLLGLVLADRYELDSDVIATAIFVTTISAILTVPAWLHLLR